jgi:hypothetical protein
MESAEQDLEFSTAAVFRRRSIFGDLRAAEMSRFGL